MMKPHPFILGAFTALALLFCQRASAAHHYGNSRYESFAREVTEALQLKVEDITLAQIHQIHTEFAGLPRTEAPIPDMREVKFLIQYWRMKTSEKILTALKTETDAEQFSRRVNALNGLNLTLSSTVIDSLTHLPLMTKSDSANAAIVALLENQGQGAILDQLPKTSGTQKSLNPLTFAMAGPRASVPIKPLEPSKYPFERWSKNPEFTHYAFTDSESRNTFRYRGMTLQAGDFILMNGNDPTDADFTSLGKERAYISHFGIVAILEKDGKRFPVGIEMHTNGVRAVPLSRFISRDFAAYVEIYRMRGMNEEWREKINTIALQELNKPRGYDFQSQDENRHFLNCVTVGSLFLELSGVAPFEAQTQVRKEILDDFQKLGLTYDHLLTPTDIARSPRVDLVGTIDQGTYAELMGRDLTAGQLVRVFDEGTVDFRKAPLMYYVYRWSVGQIKRGTIPGKIILAWKKMDAGSLPNAPTQLLGWVIPFENRYRTMVKESLPLLTAKIMKMEPSLEEIQADPEIRQILEGHSKKLRKLFSKTNTPALE